LWWLWSPISAIITLTIIIIIIIFTWRRPCVAGAIRHTEQQVGTTTQVPQHTPG